MFIFTFLPIFMPGTVFCPLFVLWALKNLLRTFICQGSHPNFLFLWEIYRDLHSMKIYIQPFYPFEIHYLFIQCVLSQYKEQPRHCLWFPLECKHNDVFSGLTSLKKKRETTPITSLHSSLHIQVSCNIGLFLLELCFLKGKAARKE